MEIWEAMGSWEVERWMDGENLGGVISLDWPVVFSSRSSLCGSRTTVTAACQQRTRWCREPSTCHSKAGVFVLNPFQAHCYHGFGKRMEISPLINEIWTRLLNVPSCVITQPFIFCRALWWDCITCVGGDVSFWTLTSNAAPAERLAETMFQPLQREAQ